jgi:hypothetical protein
MSRLHTCSHADAGNDDVDDDVDDDDDDVPGEGVGACSDISSLVGWRMLVLIRV